MIYTTHGTVQNYNEHLFCHKNFLDEAQLKRYLKNRPKKFVTLKEALQGKGDAFTIDDASYAGSQAAKLFRKYNHQITFFINPFYITAAKQYWFLQLNYLLDQSQLKKIQFQDEVYPLENYIQKKAFRKKLKENIAHLPGEAERQYILSELFQVSLDCLEMPYYLKTISEMDVLELHNIGVDIQNHGWTHRELTGAHQEVVSTEIQQGKDWIAAVLNHNADYYCVPFGKARPPADLSSFTCWFLLEDKLTEGFITDKLYNRANCISL